MKKPSPNPNPINFLHANLLDQLNPKHPLLQLAENIPWDDFEEAFSPLYSSCGPGKSSQTKHVRPAYKSNLTY